MTEQEVLSSPRKARPRRAGRLTRLSDRTPLRTKLITAVLALVIMALAAISVASVVVLRSYLYTQRDTQLAAEFNHLANTVSTSSQIQLDYPYFSGSGFIVAFQKPGSQLVAGNPGPAPPGMSESHAVQSLPELPAGTWASSEGTVLITVPAQSGADTWRVIGQVVPVTNSVTGNQQTSIMLVGVDLGPVGAEVQRLITVELIVGTAIVIVLAVLGVAVVRANLRPLDDIEMTAGEIAKGHLDHRVPERDPRTEIGSLGRSLNAMLTQIETAFRAQQESERAAHQSEERMRRFIADASHELRTPLTTIRGFAAHYRQRGGAGGWRAGLPVSVRAGESQHSSSPTDAVIPVGNGGSPEEEPEPADGLSPGELDHLMGRVEAEATRMGMLVEDLLTLARLDQQRPITKAPVDVLTVAADAVQDARIVSPDRPISLSVAPGTAFLVDGDEARLRQVLGNLVNNALTHTPAGTPVRVKIARGTLEAATADGGVPPAGAAGAAEPGTGFASSSKGVGRSGAVSSRSPGFSGSMSASRPDLANGASRAGADERAVPAVALDVEDDGPGMTADQAQRVFERFYRADAARNRSSGGTGLGLAIVAGLVAAHGGTVSVRTAPGKGADFQVKLPLSPDALAADDSDGDGDEDLAL